MSFWVLSKLFTFYMLNVCVTASTIKIMSISITQKVFTHLFVMLSSPALPTQFLPVPSPCQTTDLLSVSIIVLRSIHIDVCVNSSFLLMLSSISLNGYTTVCLFIYLLMDVRIGFRLGTLIHKAALNSCIQIFVCTYAFISPG